METSLKQDLEKRRISLGLGTNKADSSVDLVSTAGSPITAYHSGEEASSPVLTASPLSPAYDDKALPKIDSLANLRVLCGHSVNSPAEIRDRGPHAIYRSSKPDRMSDEDLDEFRKLGVKCIVDFRSASEYGSSGGHDKLDKEYKLYKVKIPSKGYSFGQYVKCEEILLDPNSKDSDSPLTVEFKPSTSHAYVDQDLGKCHFLIDFFPIQYILTLLFILPWYKCLLGILHLMFDIVARNKFKTFTLFFITNAVNHKGMLGQYIDIIDHSQASICSALKLICKRENLPVLINCAHGKDRTGIISALILSCLGVEKEIIAQEYALSTQGLASIQHLVYKDIVDKYKLKQEFCGAEADTMRQLLDYIEDKYGSVQDYMKQIGFSEEEQRRLRETVEVYENSPALRTGDLKKIEPQLHELKLARSGEDTESSSSESSGRYNEEEKKTQ